MFYTRKISDCVLTHTEFQSKSNLPLRLGGLVLLPVDQLSSKLLNDGGDIRLVHGGVNLDLGEVLNDTKR